jgi:predicted Rossmann fold nucleotide-binding protein DprA/Smf involved in DNA uptake
MPENYTYEDGEVGFTGTRDNLTTFQEKRLLELFVFLHAHGLLTFHHGDCVGADATAHELACRAGFRHIVVHPPTDTKLRAYCDMKGLATGVSITIRETKPYLTRNRDIVSETAILVAAPKGEEVLRSGTWSTIRYAMQQDRHIYIIHPFRVEFHNDPFDWTPTEPFTSPWRKDA